MDENKWDLGKWLPFWPKLTERQREDLSASMTERHYGKGADLHRGGENCDGLLLVIKGQLRAYIITEEGKELTLYRLFERDICIFSASCILSSLQFEVMVSAERDSTVLHIPAEVYKRCMEDSAAISNYTNELMAERFSDVMWLLDQILSKKQDSRVAAFLLEESLLAGSDTLSLTHEQVAGHLGTVREVVTRMLKYFQSEGMVSLGRGSILLLDRARLSQLASASLH